MAAAGAGARTCTFPGCSAVALVILTDAIVRCDDHTKLCGDLHDYEGDCETSTRRCKTMATRTDLVNCLAIIGTVQQCVAKIDAFAESGCVTVDPSAQLAVKRKAAERRNQVRGLWQLVGRYIKKDQKVAVALLVVIVLCSIAIARR